ncbi:hypothetical protein AB0G05_19520 [Nonomuraea wenchangensis]
MTLDQFYDVQPNVGRLFGGPHDGLRVTFGREWPFVWRVPAPAGWSALDSEFDPLAPIAAPMRHPTYERTTSVDDDGVRVYRYVGDL